LFLENPGHLHHRYCNRLKHKGDRGFVGHSLDLANGCESWFIMASIACSSERNAQQGGAQFFHRSGDGFQVVIIGIPFQVVFYSCFVILVYTGMNYDPRKLLNGKTGNNSR